MTSVQQIYHIERAHQADMIRDHYLTPCSSTGRLLRINSDMRFALAAWEYAKTKARFSKLESDGLARIRRVPDEYAGLDYILENMLDMDVSLDDKPHIMERERQHEIDRAYREGVWGHIAEAWNGRDWVELDSIFGFIDDDFERSGYDKDLMNSCIVFLKHCPTCHQPLPRDDSYQETTRSLKNVEPFNNTISLGRNA